MGAPARRSYGSPTLPGPTASDSVDGPVVLHVDVRRDDDPLVAAGHELAHALGRRSLGHALLVRARRAVAEARRPETVDVDGDGLLEAGEERQVVRAVLRRVIHGPRVGCSSTVTQLDECALRVAANEACRNVERAHERERLLRERAPGEVAAEDDEVGRLPLDLLEHGGERRRVPVDVRERGDAHAQPVVRPETESWFSACLMRCSSCQRSAVDSPASTFSSSAFAASSCPRARSSSISFTLDRVVDERERTVELDLEEARAGRELEHLVRAQVDARRAGLEGRDERRVPREDADLAGGARHDDHLRLAVERRAVGRDERDVELRMRLGHQLCARSESARADSDRA